MERTPGIIPEKLAGQHRDVTCLSYRTSKHEEFFRRRGREKTSHYKRETQDGLRFPHIQHQETMKKCPQHTEGRKAWPKSKVSRGTLRCESLSWKYHPTIKGRKPEWLKLRNPEKKGWWWAAHPFTRRAEEEHLKFPTWWKFYKNKNQDVEEGEGWSAGISAPSTIKA